MEGLNAFKKRILVHCLIIAAVAEIVFIIVKGFQPWILLGLIIGTLTAMVNFAILVRAGKALISLQSKAPVVGAYFIRLPIYGIVFFICVRLGGLYAALGCGIGFLTVPFAIMIIYGIESRLPGAKKNPLNDWTEPKEWNDPDEWDDDDDWHSL
jgi:hypothetical protein